VTFTIYPSHLIVLIVFVHCRLMLFCDKRGWRK
jgi:hypothetical protein